MTGSSLPHPSELLPWFVNGTLEGEELRRVEAHLQSCVACRREVDELRALRRQVAEAAPRPPEGGLARLLGDLEAERSRRPRGWFRPWQALVAAAVIAAAGIGLWQSVDRPQPKGPTAPPSVTRSAAGTEILRSRLPPGEVLPRRAFVLRWAVPPEWQDARFSVTVTAEDLTPVAEAHGLEGTEYRVRAEALAALPAGARLFWRVEAERPDGARRTRVFTARLE